MPARHHHSYSYRLNQSLLSNSTSFMSSSTTSLLHQPRWSLTLFMYISSFSFPSTRSTILTFLSFYVECITIHHLVPVKFKHMHASSVQRIQQWKEKYRITYRGISLMTHIIITKWSTSWLSCFINGSWQVWLDNIYINKLKQNKNMRKKSAAVTKQNLIS